MLKLVSKYYLPSNNCDLVVTAFSEISKTRSQSGLLSYWIKQNLNIESFIDTFWKTVMTRVWAAICVYLFLTYLNFASQIRSSVQQILKPLQLILCDCRDLRGLFIDGPPKPGVSKLQASLRLS